MKRNQIILMTFVSIFVFAFSHKNTEAYTFTCSAQPRQDHVNITLGVNEGEIGKWKIGVLSSDKSYSPQNVNDRYTDYISDNKLTTTYYYSVLEKGVKYNVLVFGKSTGKFEVALSDCNFTTPELKDGKCGGAVGQTFVSEPPKESLCESGNADGLIKNYNQWRWICKGQNGGKDSSNCIAKVGSTNGNDDNNNVDNKKVTDASSSGSLLVPECPPEGCGFDQIMELINKLINFLLFVIATPLAALVFVYAGIMLLTSAGNPGKLTTAKTILKNLIIGYVIALAAWLIVNTILTTLGYSGTWFLTR